MEELYSRDVLSNSIDKKIKYLCSREEKHALVKTLKYLKELLKLKDLFDYQKDQINTEINKILLYNI